MMSPFGQSGVNMLRTEKNTVFLPDSVAGRGKKSKQKPTLREGEEKEKSENPTFPFLSRIAFFRRIAYNTGRVFQARKLVQGGYGYEEADGDDTGGADRVP